MNINWEFLLGFTNPDSELWSFYIRFQDYTIAEFCRIVMKVI